ncbi:MAG TPA: SRPBCC domain-containing protein [Bryobacteraceae bacterium]|nr:SRPBCC domain-containing protein [Bryobacteraceae bacterium]
MTASSARNNAGKNKLTISAPTNDPVIVMTREFDAPRELVFAMYTRPEHVKRWWGPRYITLSTCEIDLRPGGAWRYVFSKSDGPGMTFKGVYDEIVPPEKLVYTLIYDMDQIRDHPALVTETFEALGNRTKMTQIVRHDSFASRDGHLNSGMESGAAETFDRLEELLATMPRELTLKRVFDAPRDLLFKAWTDRDRLQQWWGPKGFTNPVCEIDVRPGGAIEIHMRGPDGNVYPMKGEFREIVEPERLVFTSSATNRNGERMFEMLNTVTFAERGGKTEMTLDVRALMVTGDAAYPLQGMTQGWTETLERLGAEVAHAALSA